MANPSVEPSTLLPSRQTLLRGIQAFILFSAAGTLLGLWWKRPAGLADVLAALEWPFVLALIPLIALDYWLGGLRYRLFLNGKTFPSVSLWQCMRSNWANMFMGAATPFQTGGAPAQIYMLWRQGVRVADTLVISAVNLCATLLFFLLSSLVALYWIPPGLFGDNFTPVFQTGFIIVAGVAGVSLLILFFPHAAYAVLQKIVGWIPLQGERTLAIRGRLLARVSVETQRFDEGFQIIRREHKAEVLLTIIATLILFSNKYLMGYVIAHAIGQPVPFDVFIGLQVVQLLLIYFAPTPGASGVAELSSVWLMEKLMPASMVLVYAVIWRFATTILAAIIGGAILIGEVRQIGKERTVTPSPDTGF